MGDHPLLPAVESVSDRITEVGTWPISRRIEDAEEYADAIGSGADVLSRTDARKIRLSEIKPDQVREAVAYGLAILAHRPGGVGFGGLHWCTAEHPDCGGSGVFDLRPSTDNGNRGADYTPRPLTEEVTGPTLEAVLYDPGPLHTGDRSRWKLLPSTAILAKRTGDISVGSGVFLLAAGRYYADRLVEAWRIEAGLPLDGPADPAALLHARRLAMDCLYGVDIDPTSVELARLSLALLAPTVPVDLSRTIQCGDSLLGITSWEHIARMSLDLNRPVVIGPSEIGVLRNARDFGSVSEMLPWLLADLVAGAALRVAGTKSQQAKEQAWGEAARLGQRLLDNPAAVMEQTMRTAQDWLDTDLPEGNPPRRPMHWPLAFPEVFGYGVDPSQIRSRVVA